MSDCDGPSVLRTLLYIDGKDNDGRAVQVTESNGEVSIGVSNEKKIRSVKLQENEVVRVKKALSEAAASGVTKNQKLRSLVKKLRNKQYALNGANERQEGYAVAAEELEKLISDE